MLLACLILYAAYSNLLYCFLNLAKSETKSPADKTGLVSHLETKPNKSAVKTNTGIKNLFFLFHTLKIYAVDAAEGRAQKEKEVKGVLKAQLAVRARQLFNLNKRQNKTDKKKENLPTPEPLSSFLPLPLHFTEFPPSSSFRPPSASLKTPLPLPVAPPPPPPAPPPSPLPLPPSPLPPYLFWALSRLPGSCTARWGAAASRGCRPAGTQDAASPRSARGASPCLAARSASHLRRQTAAGGCGTSWWGRQKIFSRKFFT